MAPLTLIQGIDLPEAQVVQAKNETPAPISLVKQSDAERRASTPGFIKSVRAVASDPNVYDVARMAPSDPARDEKTGLLVGGQRAQYPAWVMEITFALVAKFQSLSGICRELADPDMWEIVLKHAAPHVGPGEITAMKALGRGPTRGQAMYYRDHRLDDDTHQRMAERHTEIAVQRMIEVGFINPDREHNFNHIERHNALVVDGKTVNSPVRRLKGTVRVDDARGLYGEGGGNLVWGSKWVIPEVSGFRANLRVIPTIQYIPYGKGSSEAAMFVDTVKTLVPMMTGLDALIVDGALQGAAIDDIQTTTGIAVVCPPRRSKKPDKSIQVGKYRYEAQRLPYDSKHAAHAWTCHGPELWACAGTLWERLTLDDGTDLYRQISRGSVKRQEHTDRAGVTRYKFTAKFTIEACQGCGERHEWHESLTSKTTDKSLKFNRAQYLRVLGPYDEPGWNRVYPMRPSIESTNAKVERAWYGQRIPAWGKRNQAITMRAWATYMNAIARQVFLDSGASLSSALSAAA